AQVGRKAGRRTRATECASHSVVASAASAVDHRSMLVLCEHRERGTGVVVVAAKIGKIDMDGVDTARRTGERRERVERACESGEGRQYAARRGERFIRGTVERGERAQCAARRFGERLGEIVHRRTILVAECCEELAVVAFAGAVEPRRTRELPIQTDVA